MRAAVEISTIPAAFEEQVARAPDFPAVRSLHEDVTYGEFNARANRLARAISDRSTARDRPAVSLLSAGSSALVGPHASLKAGHPALSLDPRSPPDRIEAILRSSGAGILLVDRGTRNLGVAAAERAGVETIDASIDPASFADTNLGLEIDPDRPAIIVYTSGSTGAPKGVYRTHRMMMQSPMLDPRELETSPGEKNLMLARTAFAAASGGLFRTLLAGATVYPYQIDDGLSRLVAWIRSERITSYQSVPVLFREVMRAAGRDTRFPDVRSVRLGGDTVYRSDFDLFRRHFVEGTTFRMGLALSEAGGVARYQADHRSDPGQGPMPVGTPPPGVEVRLIDENGNEVPRGEIGEIEVASRNLPSGYWRNPELTATRYRDDPRGGGWRILKTGDLGRWREDGYLEHRGRIDFQVKIRGQRVDATEVETLLRDYSGAAESVVVARKDEGAEDRLVAYLRLPSGSRPSRSELRRRLRERLPEAAVPSAFVFVEALPVSPAGKIDRKALPPPKAADFNDEHELRPPRDDVESDLLEIWKRILPGEVGGIGVNFFEVGGDSLNAAELLAAIDARWHLTLALPVFLEYPTIESLANVIRTGAEASATRSPMVTIRADGSRTPLFCLPGGNGPGFNLRTIAGLAGKDLPVYAFHVSVEAGQRRPETIEAWADRFLPVLRRTQPHGPYRLIGHSIGGHIAWELASRLIAEGERVSFVAMLDSFAPGYPRRLSGSEAQLQLWKDFLSRPPAEMVRTIRRTLRRWAGRPAPAPVSTPNRPARPRDGNNLLMSPIRRYRHQALDTRVILFRAIEREEWRGFSYEAADNNWTAIVGPGLVVHPVPGDHNTLIEGAGATAVGDWLQYYLDDSD